MRITRGQGLRNRPVAATAAARAEIITDVLESFTLESFTGRVGERFRIVADETTVLEATLAEATALGEASAHGQRATPFSIIFQGPPEPLLQQRIYGFEHDELGSFDLFIVPIERNAQGVRYEAVFT
jgi:hypothetical protein